MSAATVRAQLQAFLTAGNITGLEHVYLNEPWFVDCGTWNLAANAGWGAVCWPHIATESEERITLGAAYPGAQAVGQKEITYKVGVYLLYQYLIPAQLPAGAAEDAWSAPLDGLIEAVKAHLRSDPKAGTGPGLDGVIFQQSQEPGDLTVHRDAPKRDRGKILVWQLVETTVKEIITG